VREFWRAHSRALRIVDRRFGTVTIDLAPEPGSVSFAHTELSIIDLRRSGISPCKIDHGNWIVFKARSHSRFARNSKQAASGSRVIRHGSDSGRVSRVGEECLTRFGGMFAFALWDAVRKRLLLARDPWESSRLYYHQSKQRFYFCFGGSNASAIRTGARKADPQGF